MYGQANTDGSHCYTCPPGATVNSSQTGCVCPNAPDKVWSSQKAECISNCPPGSSPPANDDNGACTQCPAGKYSDISGDAQCFDCPTNFVSTSTADRVGCTCTTTRHDGTILTNGTTTFVPRLQRCKVTCNDGYSAFYSECLSNTVPAVTIPLNCTNIGPDCYPQVDATVNIRYTLTHYATARGGTGTATVQEGYVYKCTSEYTLDTTGLTYYVNPTDSITNWWAMDNNLGTKKCTANTRTCPPCFALNASGACVFDPAKVNDPSCYNCQAADINKTYNGTQYQLYENTPTASGTSGVCKILDTAHLQALSPSPWGNDGALDNLPANCTSITDPTCHLPSAIMTLLQTTRLAAEAIR